MKQRSIKRTPISLRCLNDKCSHFWEYKGKAKPTEYVTCPKCRFKYKKDGMVKEAKTYK